jgi:hypothetical protein
MVNYTVECVGRRNSGTQYPCKRPVLIAIVRVLKSHAAHMYVHHYLNDVVRPLLGKLGSLFCAHCKMWSYENHHPCVHVRTVK